MLDLLGIGVGQIGLGVDEFWDLTFEEFAAINKAYIDKVEREYRADWEQARYISYCAVLPHSKRINKPTDLLRFNWEKKKVELPDKDTLNKMFPKNIRG